MGRLAPLVDAHLTATVRPGRPNGHLWWAASLFLI